MKPPKIINETSYDGRRVGGIVRFVFRYLDLNGSDVMVKVKHHNGSHAYQGRYYKDPRRHRGYVRDRYWGGWQEIGPNVPLGINHLIVCRLGKPGIYPRRVHVYDRKDAPDPWVVEDWQEALVSITAHEAMHLRQAIVPKSRNRGRFNEVDTEWAAYRLLMEWRSKH